MPVGDPRYGRKRKEDDRMCDYGALNQDATVGDALGFVGGWRDAVVRLAEMEKEKIAKARAYDQKDRFAPVRTGRLPQPDMGEDE